MTETLDVCVSARDHVRGAKTARVTLVAYGNVACPHYARAFPVVKELLLHYRTTLRFVLRHNPRTGTAAGARLASHAAEAAGAQGKFWPMHDLFLERHEPISESLLVDYATLLGLDVPRFRLDLGSPEIARRVRDDEIDALRSRMLGTPTFFVNGRRFEDRPNFEALFMAIGFSLLSCCSGKQRVASAKRV